MPLATDAKLVFWDGLIVIPQLDCHRPSLLFSKRRAFTSSGSVGRPSICVYDNSENT